MLLLLLVLEMLLAVALNSQRWLGSHRSRGRRNGLLLEKVGIDAVQRLLLLQLCLLALVVLDDRRFGVLLLHLAQLGHF